MKSKLFLGAIFTVILVGGNIFAAGKPKVTMDMAQAVALKKIPGTVEKSEMHKKDYLFIIRGDDGIKRDVYVGENGKVKKLIVDEK